MSAFLSQLATSPPFSDLSGQLAAAVVMLLVLFDFGIRADEPEPETGSVRPTTEPSQAPVAPARAGSPAKAAACAMIQGSPDRCAASTADLHASTAAVISP